jgi:hypothetical protein
MSENYSETCAINTCDAQTSKDRTGKLAAVALGTALLLSLIGAFNLDRDVKIVTNDQVPYINQRIQNVAPDYVAAVNKNRIERGM